MAQPVLQNLSRRERQIMDIVYQLGSVSAADIREKMPDPPSYSAVRALLRVLEDKGHLTHEQDGQKYLYKAVHNREKVRTSALRQMLTTFFDGKPEQVVAALLDLSRDDLSEEDLGRLEEMIRAARD